MQVNLVTFRNTTDHLFKLTRDLSQCVGRNERESLGEIMKRILKESEEQEVKRAKPYDKERRINATQRIEACIIQAFSEEGRKANETYSKKLVMSYVIIKYLEKIISR